MSFDENNREKMLAALEMETKKLDTDLEYALANIPNLHVLGSHIPTEWRKEENADLTDLAVSDVFDSSYYLQPFLSPSGPQSKNIEVGTATLDPVFVGSFRDAEGQLQLVARLDVGMEVNDDVKGTAEHVPFSTHYVSTTVPLKEEGFFIRAHVQQQKEKEQMMADKEASRRMPPHDTSNPSPTELGHWE